MTTNRANRSSSSLSKRPIRPKQETFSSFTSLSRLRRIQSLIKSDSTEEDDNPDAILCILGIDGRYNDGMIDLANYLFFDLFKMHQKELNEYGITEEIIEDVMFVIRSDRVDFYSNPRAIHHFLPYISSWMNLRLYCLREDEYGDDDEDEEFKIRSFIAMVEGCSNIGLPFYASCQPPKKFDPMLIEKWPIVQAFALEGFGGGGFFTLKYKVMDVSTEVYRIYQLLDPVALEILVTEKLGFFERHWDNVLALCEQHMRSSSDLTEENLCEPLRSYYEHGNLGSSEKQHLEWTPFVLFGPNTSKRNLKSIGTGKREVVIDVKSTTHMICQASSPRGQLRCRRTYFFRQDHSIFPIDSDESLDDDVSSVHINDVRILSITYKACISAVREAIQIYSTTLDTCLAEIRARNVFGLVCEILKLPVEIVSQLTDNIEINIEHHDLNSRNVLRTGKVLEVVKSAVVTVYDIPSFDQTGCNLGSVSYADSFVNSTIDVQHSEERLEINGESVAITCAILPFMTWTLSESRKRNDLILKEDHQKISSSFGSQLFFGESVHFSSYDGLLSNLLRNGQLYIFENLIAFTHKSFGHVFLPVSQLSSISFFDGGGMNVIAVVVFTCKDNFDRFLPISLKSIQDNKVVCFLSPKTKAYRMFFSHVLSFWKGHVILKNLLNTLEQLPSDLTLLHRQVHDDYLLTSEKSTSTDNDRQSLTVLKTAKCRLPQLNSLIDHLLINSAGKQTIPSMHLEALLGAEYDQGVFENNQLILTVVSGTSGSHKNQLFQSLKKQIIIKDKVRWIFFKPSIFPSHEKKELEKSLEKIWTEWKKTEMEDNSTEKRRALIVLPGFTDPVDFIQSIQNHPNQVLSKQISVGCWSLCLDPMDFVMEHLFTFPKVLNSCFHGLVNNIVITNTSCQDDQINLVRRLIKFSNSDVYFLSADQGIISRSHDLDLMLSENAFNTSSLIKARYLNCPGWWQGRYETGPSLLPEMNEIRLKFFRPLERSRLLSRLKGLKKNLKRLPFHGNIYYVEGKLQFTDSSHWQDLVYITLSGFLKISPASSTNDEEEEEDEEEVDGTNNSGFPFYHLKVTGCKLEEKRLKDWLRECTQQSQEKRVRTRDSLTPTEIRTIHKEHHLEELPEGWFYNGRQFVSMIGERTDLHPNLEKYLQDYLEKQNEEINEYNASLDKDHRKDLFDSQII